MMCRSQNCGAEGLFHETEGYCSRCYEEIKALREDEERGDDYYLRQTKHREELIMPIMWLAIAGFAFFILRALWLMFFE